MDFLDVYIAMLEQYIHCHVAPSFRKMFYAIVVYGSNKDKEREVA